MTYTVLGASGFIGRHLATAIQADGHECILPARDSSVRLSARGHVFYCIGLTADFRGRPLQTVEAHVTRLLEVLHAETFDSLLYLSSTRLYAGLDSATEEARVAADPSDPDAVYNISKMMGEATCLSLANPAVRVVRLSNVYGPGSKDSNFLSSIVRDAVRTGRITLRTSPASVKDYVSIDDVVGILPRISEAGRCRVYNVASGVNTSHGELVAELARLTGCAVELAEGSSCITYPPIDIGRVRGEFGFAPRHVLDDLGTLVEAAS